MPPVPAPRRRTGPALAIGIGVLVVALLGGGVVFLGSGGDDEEATDDRTDEADRSATDDESADDGGPRFETIPLPGGPTEPAPTTPPDPAPSEGEPVDLSVVQLEAALLGRAERPDLTPETSPGPQTSDLLTSAQMTVSDECRALLEDHEARGTRPNFGGGPAAAPRYAARRFSGAGVTVEHELADGAEVTLDEYRSLLTACETIEWEGGGRLRFTVLDEVLELGDEALRVEYAFGGSESIVQWVLWSRDGIIASLNVSEVGNGSGGGSEQASYLLEDLAYQADAILAEVIASR